MAKEVHQVYRLGAKATDSEESKSTDSEESKSTPPDDRRQGHSASTSRSPPPRQPTPPPRQPTPPPPRNTTSLKKRKAATPPRPTQKKGRAAKIVDIPPAPPVRAYDMTPEEIKAIVDAEVKAFFAPKVPEPKVELPPKTVEHFVELLERPSIHDPSVQKSDYERELIKTYKKAQREKSASAKSRSSSSHTTTARGGKKVPQLGCQEKQSIPPLQVSSSLPDPEYLAGIAASLGCTVEQLVPDNKDGFVGPQLPYRYAYGKPLVRPEQIHDLPTQMRRLHDWYMDVTKEGRLYLYAKVRKEHYFHEDEIIIHLEELFQLYNQDALDKSIMSNYCL